jgi:hypothetical protein
MIETFIDVQGYEGLYTVSNTGKVYSVKNKIILKPDIDKDGYEVVRIYHRELKTKRAFKVHRLVLFNFYPTLDKSLQVNHIDSDKRNNSLSNLEGVNTRENSTHRGLKKNRASKYVGVSWHKGLGKWRAIISINRKPKSLGCYDCETDAYSAYLKALKENNLINKYA